MMMPCRGNVVPCNECAKAIIQCGIKKIIYLDNKYAGTKENQAAEMMFRMAGIEVEEYQKNGQDILLSL